MIRLQMKNYNTILTENDDDDDDDELLCGMVDRRKAFSLFPAGTIVRDPHHRKSPTRCE